MTSSDHLQFSEFPLDSYCYGPYHAGNPQGINTSTLQGSPHVYAPEEAPDEFLISIGLEPRAFRQWLPKGPPYGYGKGHWADVLRRYFENCSYKSVSCDNAIQELQEFGLTDAAANFVVKRIGHRYYRLLPEQIAEAEVEDNLSQCFLGRPIKFSTSLEDDYGRALYESRMLDESDILLSHEE